MNRKAVGSVMRFVGIIALGAILGYVGGWVIWWICGQIQLFLRVGFPYCAIYSPPSIYQVSWTIFGAIALLFKEK